MKKRFWRKWLAVILAAALAAGLAACGNHRKKDTETGKSAKESTEFSERNPAKLDDITLEALADEILETMTLEEKIGQMFLVCTDDLDYNAETAMTDEMENNLKTYKPGGIIMFSFNIENRNQITTFIQSLQDSSELPLFIAVDEEGGNVARIANTDGIGTTKFPAMAEIGATGNTKKAYEVGSTIGSEISELGFNLDFAPVADITSEESNSEIGSRSFGTDKDVVGDMAAAVVKGLQANNVSATLKHFPGQGDLEEDTHAGYANLGKTIDELRETEFKPFQKGIKAGADFVMISHASVKNITENDVPSSLSSLIVSDILKDELQFEGVTITDALNMKSITKFYDADEAAIAAVNAGEDIILMSEDYEMAYEGVLNAAEDGDIKKSTINSAVKRILMVKIKRGIIPLNSKMFSINQE